MRVVGPSFGLDAQVGAAPGTPMSAVVPALAQLVGLPPRAHTVWVGGQEVAPATPLGSGPLGHGAELRFSPPPRPAAPLGPFALAVVGGPDAGTQLPVAAEELVVGRAAECALQLDDPAVSRRHAAVRLDAHGLTVRDLGSTNGTQVDGVELGTSSIVLPPDGVLRLGETSLSLAAAASVAAATRPTTDGHLAHNRPPRLRPPVRDPLVSVPVEPVAREAARIPLLAVLLPLLLGVVMAVFVSPIFLLFVLLSPVMVVGNVLSDRRSGRRDHQRALAAYRAALGESQRAVAAAIADDERRRRRAAPDPAAVVAIAVGPLSSLWERRRHDDDVLALRLGLADRPARVELTRSAGEHGAEPLPQVPPARSVPVVVAVVAVGVLGLAGPPERTRALARALVLQAAVLHSPRDLRIIVLCAGGERVTPSPSPWAWTRWLPHTTPEPDEDCRALLGLEPDQVRRRVGELSALLAARAEAADHSFAAEATAWPLVLVVLDGARALRAAPGVATLLSTGPRLGIHALCLDDEERLLPEECGAAAVFDGTPATRLTLSTAGGDVIDGIVGSSPTASARDSPIWRHGHSLPSRTPARLEADRRCRRRCGGQRSRG